MFYLVFGLSRGTSDLGNRETNEQSKITRKKLRKRKSKVKRMVEHGNIDEIRCLFFFLDAFSRLLICKRRRKRLVGYRDISETFSDVTGAFYTNT